MNYLFVYGTLRRAARHTMHQIIENQGTWLGEGTIPGHLYLVDWYPGYIPSSQTNVQVRGEVYELTDPEKIFHELDSYEGYYPEDEAHSDFLRQLMPVELTNGTVVSAWVYVYNLPVTGLPIIASGDFLNR